MAGERFETSHHGPLIVFWRLCRPRISRLLRPFLQEVELKHEAVLAKAGDSFKRVYFPNSGAISLVLRLGYGQMIEVATHWSRQRFRGPWRSGREGRPK